jgi:ATP-dependent DNA helicase RecQ
MDRPNLALAVVPVNGVAHKLAYLEQLSAAVARARGCCTARRASAPSWSPSTCACADRTSSPITRGLEPERKRELQHEFLAGRYPAIAATNALGMGIDKSDLRFVVHVDVPGSITAYYQEVGSRRS